MNIAEFIPYGHKNAISRQQLCVRTGMSDRRVREAITAANMAGELIINNGEGYFRWRDISDRPYMDIYLALEQARKKTINRKLLAMKRSYYRVLEEQELPFT